MASNPTADQPEAPVDTMSPAARAKLQRCYERGNEMASKSPPDFDYAHAMFAECVNKDPSNLVYVEAMLNNLQKKYKNNKKGASFRGFGGKGPFKKALAAGEWKEVFRIGLEMLKSNPWDVVVLRGIAQACEINRYNEVELRYLKNALDAKPKDIEVNKHCAKSLARMGQFEQSIACWRRVQENKSQADEATTRISELTMAKTMGHPLPPEAISDRDPSQVKAEIETEEETGDDLADLRAAVKNEPENVEHYIKLADVLHERRELKEEEQVLSDALAVAGSDLKIRERLEDTQIHNAKTRAAIAEKRAIKDGTDEAKYLAKRLKTDLNRLEMEIFNGRAERYPDEPKHRYDLAIRLKRAGNFSEALKTFDQLADYEEQRVSVLIESGECLQQLKRYQPAFEKYEAAVQAGSGDNPLYKLALYRAGVLATGLKLGDQAKQHLSKLVGIDGKFKDARARLDRANQIGNDK